MDIIYYVGLFNRNLMSQWSVLIYSVYTKAYISKAPIFNTQNTNLPVRQVGKFQNINLNKSNLFADKQTVSDLNIRKLIYPEKIMIYPA